MFLYNLIEGDLYEESNTNDLSSYCKCLWFCNGGYKIKIGVAIQGNKSTFMQYVVAGAQEFAKSKNDIELVVVYAEDRADKQIGQIDNFITQKVKAIVINPVDKVASAPAVAAANKSGIPIITVNTTVENQNKATAHSGSDDIVAGEMQMEFLAKAIGKKGDVAIINGVINNGLDLLNVQTFYQQIVKGAIIVVAVLLDRTRNN